MDAMRLLMSQYLRAAWRRRWTGIIVAWLACGSGWVGVYIIPNQYESAARLFVDTNAVLTPLLHGLAADSQPATQLEIIQRTLLSHPNMEKLVSKSGLDLTLNSSADHERLLSRLSNEIKVTPQTKDLFTITYRDRSAQLAHDVVQTLLTIFVESATGGSRTDMDNARRFLERQIQSYEQQLRAAETRRADFRARYIEILPADNNPSVPALEGARNQALQLEGRLQDALTSHNALKREVENTPQMLVVESGGANGLPSGGTAQSMLREAQYQLRLLLLKDTAQHPDVIAQRKFVESLKNAPLADMTGKDHYDGLRRSLPNPVYDQLKVRLIEADASIITLQRQRDDAIHYRDRLEKVQHEQPGLIAEYQNMDRDYAVLQHSHDELLGRLQSANIAQAADTQTDKVKLKIIDAPEVPRLPVAPNRTLLLSLVLLGGLGAGAGVAGLFGQLDRSFSNVEDLRALGLPVLGGISMLTLLPLRKRVMVAVRFSAAIAVLIGIYSGLVAHILRSAALI